jgi:catechol 2,3-dioxygenase-like lactoylglutathione lyase family enzyme
MPIKVVELHHHGIRIGTSEEEVKQARAFYSDVLGLDTDPARPNIPSIPGFWMYVGEGERTTQIHLMGAKGKSPMAKSEKEDPTLPHVALAVEDIEAARKELDERGIWYWGIQGLVGNNSDQVFVHDPFGNVIELHQIGTCTCNKIALSQ